MQERRIDDYWNIDGSRDFSDSWTGFTQFTLLEGKPPDGYVWSVGRLTKMQVTFRQDHLWPELWTKLGRNVKLKERHKWSIEKPKLDNARRLRGICFIDLEDMDFKETSRNARKKLETPMAPTMPCKTWKKSKKGEIRRKTHDFKSKSACILEASESTRLRMGESLPNFHVDHIAGKGDNSLQHYNLVHKFIPMPQAMKIPAPKAAVDKEWEKLEKTQWRSRTSCWKCLVTWLLQITKFSVKDVNLETITDMQSWCRTWPLNGSRRVRAKSKLRKKPREACKSSSSQTGILKSFTLTILWNLASLVRHYPGIIVRQHHTDQKQMGLLKEPYAE